jgi:PhnB protein
MLSHDGCPENFRLEGVSLSLFVSTDAEAGRLFAILAECGQVQMLGPTFFSSGFGMLTDRFVMVWIVIVESGHCAR